MADFEMCYAAYLHASADGSVIDVWLETTNPNFGGASSLGLWTPALLDASDPLEGADAGAYATLRAWAASRPAEPCSDLAARMLAEPWTEAVERLTRAVRARDAEALAAARDLAPLHVRTLLRGTVAEDAAGPQGGGGRMRDVDWPEIERVWVSRYPAAR
jgi:hypothetical protein